MTSKMVPLGI